MTDPIELLKECIPLLRGGPGRFASNVIERIQKAIALVEAEWQPIDNKAKDGHEILAYCDCEGAKQMMALTYDEGQPPYGDALYPWKDHEGRGYHKDLPTHYRELPAPPREAEALKRITE